MKIRFQKYSFEKEVYEEIEDITVTRLNGDDYETGALEAVEGTADKIAHSYGRLLRLLCEKGVIDIKDIHDIL